MTSKNVLSDYFDVRPDGTIGSRKAILSALIDPVDSDKLFKVTDRELISYSNTLWDDGVIERVKKAILFIQDHYRDAITLDHIAESIHVSKSECCRCFKRTTKEAPFDHLLIYRVFESARRMQRADASADSIQTLSKAVGFHNASYYNKIFKKYMGCTPTQYREIIKKSHRDALNPYGISLARL